MTTVRTRFAPSPTGYMHIGGMRTALFNWLWARRNGGQFILRIDDTDQERHVEAALDPIFSAFRWLGLDWDEGPDVGGDHGPYFQSQRGELYTAAIQKLLAEGKAFRDFNTAEQIEADREAAKAAGGAYLNVRRSLDVSVEERERWAAEGKGHAIRLLVPRDRKIAIEDVVRGHVEWDLSQYSDPAIARANGTPLYNLACVVDDASMRISHVIRAEEHLSNVPPQMLLYEALGHTPPTFAHIPFVTAPGTSKKLSKREFDKYRNNPQFRKMYQAADEVFPQLGLDLTPERSPIAVSYYEEVGYLPAGVLNALARLGWAFDDKTEHMSREFLIENFALDRVIKSPAGFDPDKLKSYQEHWVGALSRDEKIDRCLPYLQSAGHLPTEIDDDTREYLGQVIDAMGERIVLFSDILACDDFFTADDQLTFDEKAFAKRITKPDDAVPLLTKFRGQLASAEAFDAESLERLLKDFVEAEGVGIGQVIHALRVATTGKAKGPGMFDCLAVLGRERCLARIDRAVNIAKDSD